MARVQPVLSLTLLQGSSAAWAMPIKTGAFGNLGMSYEEGGNAALLSAIARSAEELISGKGRPEGVNELLASLAMTEK